MRTEEIILGVMLALSAFFILGAIIWGQSRSHTQRALLSFIGLLLCLPVAAICIGLLSHHR